MVMLRTAVTAARPNNPTRSPRGASIRRHNMQIPRPLRAAPSAEHRHPLSFSCSCQSTEEPNKADFGMPTRRNLVPNEASSATQPALSHKRAQPLPQQHTPPTLGEGHCQKVKRKRPDSLVLLHRKII